MGKEIIIAGFYIAGMAGIFYFDLKRRIIPDILLLALVAVAMINYSGQLTNLASGLLAALVGLVLFLGAYLLSHRSLGFGDVKMAAVVGLIFGVKMLPIVFSASGLLAIGTVLWMNRTGKKQDYAVPFGCILAVASIGVIIVNQVWGVA